MRLGGDKLALGMEKWDVDYVKVYGYEDGLAITVNIKFDSAAQVGARALTYRATVDVTVVYVR